MRADQPAAASNHHARHIPSYLTFYPRIPHSVYINPQVPLGLTLANYAHTKVLTHDSYQPRPATLHYGRCDLNWGGFD
jgi:hypothetical protein